MYSIVQKLDLGGNQAIVPGSISAPFIRLTGKKFIYSVKKDDKATAIVLTSNQWEECKFEKKEEYSSTIEIVSPSPTSIPLMKSVGFEVAVLRKQKCECTEDYVSKLIQQQLAGFPMSVGQRFILKLSPSTIELMLTVKAIADEKNNNDFSCGLFDSKTNIFLTLTKEPSARYITWHSTSTAQFQTNSGTDLTKLSQPDWKFESMDVGGLDTQFGLIMRRAFASRMASPEFVKAMGIKHVKGMLLFGVPGTGKTLIARQVAKNLTQTPVKVISGPEVLSKYVGGTEEAIRKLFEDAEKEYKSKGDESSLHVIIFDEIDSICGTRTSGEGVGASVHNGLVNQLLSKIDGVHSLNNILVIGMTNRKDMLDSALLRPGRLEVHIEIGLPDEQGRQEIFRIHTKTMRENKVLHDDVKLDELASKTKNYSGAEIEGVVKSAASFVLSESLQVLNGKASFVTDEKESKELKQVKKDTKIHQAHFLQALADVKPAFGAHEDDLKNCCQGGVLPWKSPTETIDEIRKWIKSPSKVPTVGVLLDGQKIAGAGKTTISAHIGLTLHSAGDISFVKRIGFDKMSMLSESQKCAEINKIFEDARRSKTSMIIIDDLDSLIGYLPMGRTYSIALVQTFLGAMKRLPPHPGKLVVLATAHETSILKDLDLIQCFAIQDTVPIVKTMGQVCEIVSLMMGKKFHGADDYFELPCSIKYVIESFSGETHS